MTVELQAEWVDSPPTPAAISPAVYVRCKRQVDEATKKTFLHIELLHGRHIWSTDVHEKQKPTMLDCAASEYLNVLERAFTIAEDAQISSTNRFSYKWSFEKAALTLMEHASSGFAMKYTSLQFTEMTKEAHQAQYWQDFLHDVVTQSHHRHGEVTRQRLRIQELEGLLTAKDTLLERALTAKQRLEDELFTKFCAVLNAKKQEIERLQQELTVASHSANGSTAAHGGGAAATRKRAIAGEKKKKKMGATLAKPRTKRGKNQSADDHEESSEGEASAQEDEEEDDSDSSSHGDDASENDHDESPKKATKVKRDAIQAYSQLASQLNKTTSQVYAASDVLDDLDAIMETEVEQDDAQTHDSGGRSTRTRKRPLPSSTAASEKKPKVHDRAHDQAPRQPAKPAKPAKITKPASQPMDSEEEDILDMLS